MRVRLRGAYVPEVVLVPAQGLECVGENGADGAPTHLQSHVFAIRPVSNAFAGKLLPRSYLYPSWPSKGI